MEARQLISKEGSCAVLEDILHMLLVILVPSQLHPLSKTSFPLCFAVPQPTKVALSARGSSNQISSASLGAHRAPYLFVFQIWMVSGSAIP